MNKINLYELKEDIYLSLSVLAIKDMDALFRINKRYSADEVFLSLVRDVILKFERYYPYKTTLKVPKVACVGEQSNGDSWVNLYYTGSSASTIRFYDNTEQVFYNLLDESELSMIPLQVKRLQMSRMVDHVSSFRRFTYEAPNLYGCGVDQFSYYSGLFRYPIITDMRGTDVVQLDKSWLLFMFKGSSNYRTFLYAMIVKVCDYIKNEKNNLNLPNLPLEIFGALDEVKSPYQEIVQQEYQSAVDSLGWD